MTSHALDEPNKTLFVAVLVGSIVAHTLLVSSMNGQTPIRTMRRSVEMAFLETPRAEEKKPEVVPPPAPAKLKRAVVKAERSSAATPTPTKEPVPAVGGVTPDSTTPIGAFVIPPGNTTFAPAATSIAPRVGPSSGGAKDAPPGSADREPSVIGEVKVDYPVEARRNEVEGEVRLRVTTDARGAVTSVRVISGPGYGLDEAARDALMRFRFSPATKDGEAVGYTFTYVYRFELN